MSQQVASRHRFPSSSSASTPTVAYYDFSSNLPDIKKATIYGLIIGDCLGSTSEFKHPNHVHLLIDKDQKVGWPFDLVPNMTWKKGESTDDSDLALAILQSFHECGSQFNPEHVCEKFLAWLDGEPKDVGFTTRKSLLYARKARSQNKENYWSCGSLELFKENQSPPSNGALMRNGVVPLLSSDINQILEWTILHSIVTHYTFEAILPCIVHSIVIHRALESHRNQRPLEIVTTQSVSDILTEKSGEWYGFKQLCNEKKVHPIILEWIKNNGGKKALEMEEKKVMGNLKEFETFNPYDFNYKNISGWSVLSLKIALWTLYHSAKVGTENFTRQVNCPPQLPSWVFEDQPRGFESVIFSILTGADADTYGAITGCIMGVYYPELIPCELVDQLLSKNLVEQFHPSIPKQ